MCIRDRGNCHLNNMASTSGKRISAVRLKFPQTNENIRRPSLIWLKSSPVSIYPFKMIIPTCHSYLYKSCRICGTIFCSPYRYKLYTSFQNGEYTYRDTSDPHHRFLNREDQFIKIWCHLSHWSKIKLILLVTIKVYKFKKISKYYIV